MASLSLTSDVESNVELIPDSPPIAAHACDAFNTLDALKPLIRSKRFSYHR